MYGSVVENEIMAGWSGAEMALYDIVSWRDHFLFKSSRKLLKHSKQGSNMIRNLFWKDKLKAHIKNEVREWNIGDKKDS